MCVSAAPARFTGTILYHGLRRHPERGRVHVVGYQNTAQNFASGPNAMLLHLPARGMTQANFIDTSGCPRILRDMVDALQPVSRGYGGPVAPAGAPGGPPPVQIFDHDIYTVVLATDPTLIPDALQSVPPHKRIPVNRPLFDFYAELYPGYAVALCCFDNRQAMQANPLLMWYTPLDEQRFALPAIDCHTGEVPNLRSTVYTDHWTIFGTDEAQANWGAPVRYSHPRGHGPADSFLPDQVIGRPFKGYRHNGDVVIPYAAVLAGDLTSVAQMAAPPPQPPPPLPQPLPPPVQRHVPPPPDAPWAPPQ